MADYEAVYRQHAPAVFRYAVRCAGRRDLAEEFAADAFLALFKAFDRIDQGQLPGWLFTVIRNRAIDHWRRAALEARYLADFDAQPVVAAKETITDWLDAVPALTTTHRACLILRYVHGLERAEIAKRLGLGEMQVKGYLQYARQLLRKTLVDHK